MERKMEMKQANNQTNNAKTGTHTDRVRVISNAVFADINPIFQQQSIMHTNPLSKWFSKSFVPGTLHRSKMSGRTLTVRRPMAQRYLSDINNQDGQGKNAFSVNNVTNTTEYNSIEETKGYNAIYRTLAIKL